MSLHSILTDLAKKMPAMRTVARKVVNNNHRRHYLSHNYKNNKVEQKLVLFETFNGRSYACSPKAIYLAMLSDERFAEYRFVWAFLEPEKHTLPDAERTSVVESKSEAYLDACASAGLIVINSNFPERVVLKPEQRLLETWHGTPLKRLGYDIDVPDGAGDAMNSHKDVLHRYDINSKRFSYLISPSPFTTDKLSSAFNLAAIGKGDIVRELGYPRNDALINHTPEDAAAMRASLGIPKGKKILLYAPTYRDNSHQSGLGYTYESPVDFDKLREALGEEWVVLFRAHYFVANSFDFAKYEGFVWDCSRHDDINDLYIISDVLVTDYSSVFFDFANLRRPMLFFMYDLEQYRDNLRGFYFDYNEVPGPIFRTQEELVEELGQLGSYEQRFGERYDAFHAKFNPLDDGSASRRVLDFVLADTSKTE